MTTEVLDEFEQRIIELVVADGPILGILVVMQRTDGKTAHVIKCAPGALPRRMALEAAEAAAQILADDRGDDAGN